MIELEDFFSATRQTGLVKHHASIREALVDHFENQQHGRSNEWDLALAGMPDIEVTEFEDWCQSSWGASTRSRSQLFTSGTLRIQDAWDFNKTPDRIKAYIAEKLILESCSRIGAFAESGDVSWFQHSIQDL